MDVESTTDRVTVAAAETLLDENARAIVRLLPQDHGVPVVLVRDGAFTARDLDRGLEAASVLLKRYGPTSTKRVHLVLHDSPRPTPREARFEKYLPVLREATPRAIPGIGMVRAFDIRMARRHPTDPESAREPVCRITRRFARRGRTSHVARPHCQRPSPFV